MWLGFLAYSASILQVQAFYILVSLTAEHLSQSCAHLLHHHYNVEPGSRVAAGREEYDMFMLGSGTCGFGATSMSSNGDLKGGRGNLRAREIQYRGCAWHGLGVLHWSLPEPLV